jgi:hypothetical protein
MVIRGSIVVAFFAVLVVIIALARGYRLDLSEKTVTSTGILALNSAPNAAKIYINDELEGVTNTNLTLPPGDYSIRITKEGFTEWQKDVTLLGEIVLSFEAVLFPRNPSLSPLTNLGIQRALPVGQSDTIMLFSETGDPEQDGIYILDGNSRRLSLSSPLQPIVTAEVLPDTLSIASAEVSFSPDYQEAIITFPVGSFADDPVIPDGSQPDEITDETTPPSAEASEETESNAAGSSTADSDQPAVETVSYLMSLTEENTELFEVTDSEDSLLNAWEQERQQQLAKILETFPEEIEQIATDSFRIIAFSPDETKILYQAIDEEVLPLAITPPLIGANQTLEEREIQPGLVYVYDRTEDKNFPIPVELDDAGFPADEAVLPSETKPTEEAPSPSDPPLASTDGATGSQDQLATDEAAIDATRLDISAYQNLDIMRTIQWYPSSFHLVLNETDTIAVIEYDGTNRQAVYSGPYSGQFFALNSDWKLLVLANLNPQNNQFQDVYEIGIR